MRPRAGASSRPVTPLARRACCRKRSISGAETRFADFRFDGFAQAEIGRLEELHGSAVADRVDARLALGRAEELITELKALVREQPLWERPRRQLMLALYQAGRQADALELYQSTRRLLANELGLDPSAELQALERAILNQAARDREADPARSRVRAQRQIGRPILRGAPSSAAKLSSAELTTGLERCLAGRGRLFLLVGEPGHRQEQACGGDGRASERGGARVLGAVAGRPAALPRIGLGWSRFAPTFERLSRRSCVGARLAVLLS